MWQHDNIKGTYFGAMIDAHPDSGTDWSEGISFKKNDGDNGWFSFVNSALSNSLDLKDGKKSPKKSEKRVSKRNSVERSENGRIARETLRICDLEESKNYLIEKHFDGCSIMSNGKELVVLEIQLDPKKYQEYFDLAKENLGIEKDDEDTTNERFTEITNLAKKFVKEEDYIHEELDIKKDYMVVRTNHGVLDDGLGYIPQDGDSFESSVSRRELMMKELEENVYNTYDLVNLLSDTSYWKEKYSKLDYYKRPIRIPQEEAIEDGDKVPEERPNIFTTSSIVLNGNNKECTLFYNPINCTFSDDLTINKMIKQRYVNIIINPRNLRINENFGEYLRFKLMK